jgi:FMN phosphatase YigB (HAD superfamily)
LELSGFLGSVTISSEAGYAKPALEIFRAALAKHGAEAAEAMHVGDSEHLDCAGAVGAGIDAVLLDPAAAQPFRIDGRCARVSSLTGVLDAARQSPFP